MIIGLTGGIASGKSVAAEQFEQAGFLLIDVDKVGHRILQENKVQKILRKKFGNEIFNNEKIDRKKLGSIVFRDKDKLKFLNSLMHKLMRQKIKKELNENKGKDIVIDAALLYEMKLDKWAELVLVVTASDDKIMARVKQRNQFSEEKIKNILSVQKATFKSRPDHKIRMIANNGTKEEFKAKILNFIAAMGK